MIAVCAVALLVTAPAAWSVDFSASPSTIDPTQSAVLTASASLPSSNYGLRIFDTVDETQIAFCWQATCTATVTMPWSENWSPADRVYRAELFYWAAGNLYTESQAELTVGHRAADMSIALTSSRSTIDPTQSAVLTANLANGASLPSSRHGLRIFDTVDGTQIALCWQTNCTATATMPWSENGSPEDRVYRAELFYVDGGNHYNVESEAELTVYHEPRRFSVRLALAGSSPGEATATVSPTVSGTGHVIKIRSATGTQVETCTTGATCSASISDGTYYANVENSTGTVFGQSRYWTLSAGEATDETVEGFNTYTLVAAFASAGQLCDALLTGPGTHTRDSSLTDQYLDCEVVAQAGGTARAALKKALEVAGAAKVLLYIADYIDHYADPDTGTVSPPPAPPPPNAPWRPIPAPLLSSQQDSLDIDTLMNNNPDTFDDRDEAKVALQSCKTVALRDDCLSLPIFVPGDLDMPQTTKHNREAIYTGGRRPVLNWMSPADRVTPRDWYDKPANLPNRCGARDRSTHACDEYPFHTTRQGGPGASLKPVVLPEAGIQGNRLSAFYRKCNLQTAAAPPFIVAPAPAHSKLPTLKICNGR